MLEYTTTRANPLVDPHLHVWSWEIPVYLFLGGIVAGMMVLAGLNMLRTLDHRPLDRDYPVQTPLLAFVLLNLGMGALFLDLAHKLYVWAVYLTFQPHSPMSWGSWMLILVFPVLLASALLRLPQSWPWLARRVPALTAASDWLLAHPGAIRTLAWLNLAGGVGLGIYTGILLNTMVARPLWNTAILGPLFLFSGLSAAAALVHLVSGLARSPAPDTMLGGALSSIVQPLTPQMPDHARAEALTRADIAFLAIELTLIALMLIGLSSSSESHVAAAKLLTGGPFTAVFWVGVVAIGIVIPMLLQALELSGRVRHTVIPALLVLGGGITLRWVMVGAGQFSHLVAVAGP